MHKGIQTGWRYLKTRSDRSQWVVVGMLNGRKVVLAAGHWCSGCEKVKSDLMGDQSVPSVSSYPYPITQSRCDMFDPTHSAITHLSQLYPSGHVFGPPLSSFHTKFTCYSKSLCEKQQKHHIIQDIPLVLNTTRRGGYLNYLAGVSLQLTPRFAHTSSSDPSTARSSLEGPATSSCGQHFLCHICGNRDHPRHIFCGNICKANSNRKSVTDLWHKIHGKLLGASTRALGPYRYAGPISYA